MDIVWGLLCVFLIAYLAFLWLRLRAQQRSAVELAQATGGHANTFAQALKEIKIRLKDDANTLHARDNEIEQRKQITNAVPDGLFLLDHEHRIKWCNQAALVMHSLDAFRDIGKPITQLIRAPEFIAFLQRSDETATVISHNNHALLCRLEPSGDDTRLLLTRDVTERERLDRMRRDFVANVSHEMRTPLTVMGGFIETLQNLPLSESERARYLAMVGTQTHNMQRLVEDLLTLARLENVQISAEQSKVDLAQIVRAALDDARALSNGDHVFDATLEDLSVRGSPTELTSAVNNLLSNAVRYTSAGGHIAVRVQQDAGAVIFEVSDNGVGIAAEHIPRLTERFYRVDRSRSRETGGTGLGLAIVKHIAQRHHAIFEIESEVLRGSTFRLRFAPYPAH